MDRYAHWLARDHVGHAGHHRADPVGSARRCCCRSIGYTLFSWLATFAKNVHNFVGPVLIVAVPLMFVRYVRDNGFGIEDLKLVHEHRGLLQGPRVSVGQVQRRREARVLDRARGPVHRTDVTGLVLVFPNFDQTRATMQTANVIHMVAAYVAIALACVHIYLGTIGMTDAYRAMRHGYVDASWAKHHHARWYEDVVAGRAREKFVAPEALQDRIGPRPHPR